MTFADLQEKQVAWRAHNFPGEHPAWHPLLGVLEEMGELCHAHLKEAQGIRGTSEEHQAKAKDAIADAIIYLADFCSRSGVALGGHMSCLGISGWQKAGDPVNRADLGEPHRLLLHAQARAGTLALEHLDGDISANSIGLLLAYLADYCTARGWDMGEIVESVWSEVSKRDWRAYPATGRAEVVDV